METAAPTWSVRPVHPDHAASIITLMQATIAEPVNNLMSEPGEFTYTVEQERAFLAEQIIRPDWVGFVATPNNAPRRVIGLVMATGKGRRAVRHRASIGLTVAHGWRGQGVGRALMEHVIAWARETGFITRLELEVLVRNESAVRLYERLGFQREGLHRHALLRNGEYLDDLSMALLLD